ncbi:hypothetical protein MLD38_019648 [Melastoma candidum]|uniref:Uncharacterized protein n=1 Tax=Melastoma candidum TaxID=119954 RepID=A0ACB9R5Y8_9MYRT|nr:hypothetical protein MLD38_019648 [Melastoma candidum]
MESNLEPFVGIGVVFGGVIVLVGGITASGSSDGLEFLFILRLFSFNLPLLLVVGESVVFVVGPVTRGFRH